MRCHSRGGKLVGHHSLVFPRVSIPRVTANGFRSMITRDYSQPKAEWSARMGTVRLSSTSPWQQERRIVGMIKSPVEGSTTVLLKLDRPVTTFSDFVRPVCLPSNQDPPVNASQCNTLGWARNRE